MPLSNEPPLKLFRLLRDRVGGKARRRGEFTEEELCTELEVEDKISFNTQPEINELLARVKECGAVLQQHKHTFGNTGEHLKRAVVDDIVRWAQETSGEDSLALLLDQAGMGKTIVARN